MIGPMTTVILYGHLARQFGRTHRFAVASPAEAVRALCANYKGFKAAIMQDGQMAYRVLAGKEDRADIETLHLPAPAESIIKIIPVMAGSKGLGQILLGAVLIGASFYLPTTPILAGFELSASSIAFSIGTSLALGGISQALFAPATVKSTSAEKANNKPSYAFNGAVNTVGQGNPVPLAYGHIRVGSQVISAGLSAENL